MYKSTSKNMQNRASALNIKTLQSGGLVITPQDEYEALKRKCAVLQERLANLPKKSEERKKLCSEYTKARDRIRELKEVGLVESKHRKGVERFFIDVVKERITPALFKIYWREAVERCNQDE